MKPLPSIILFSLSLVLSVSNLFAQSDQIVDLMEQAKTLRDKYEDTKALAVFEKILQLDGNNMEALYNAGYLYSRLGWMAEDVDKEKAKGYYTKSKYFADRTYKLYPASFEANLLMAGAIARLAQYGTTKERVTTAWDIKKYADVAAKLKPEDPILKHMLAWWNYELSKPTWFERSMADMLFGGIPKGADINKAIKMMKELITLRPDYIVYRYDIALMYEYLGDQKSALAWVQSALKISPKAPEEYNYIVAGKKLQERLM
ncbi:hypothetical protein BH09BAC1_BH09BAC1_06000 [soil metagenome]